jgi:hypothetical protein
MLRYLAETVRREYPGVDEYRLYEAIRNWRHATRSSVTTI